MDTGWLGNTSIRGTTTTTYRCLAAEEEPELQPLRGSRDLFIDFWSSENKSGGGGQRPAPWLTQEKVRGVLSPWETSRPRPE